VLPAHIPRKDKTQHGSDEFTGRLLQAKHGWDVLKALKHIQAQSGPASPHAKAAAAIEKRVRKVRQAAAIFAPRARPTFASVQRGWLTAWLTAVRQMKCCWRAALDTQALERVARRMPTWRSAELDQHSSTCMRPCQFLNPKCMMRQAGHNYFRVHPKGNGILVRRSGGLPPVTFVSEYLGEMHTPARWFEIQVRPHGWLLEK